MSFHSSFVPTLLATSEPLKPSAKRPILQYVHVDGLGRYETTDSYTLTRITPKTLPQLYPDTKAFFSASPDWQPVDKNALISACELAISTHKALGKAGKKLPTLELNGPDTLAMPGTEFETKRPLPQYLGHATRIDPKRLLPILKSTLAFPRSLEWYQLDELSPLQFRQETEYGTIETIIMPLLF